MAPRNRRSAAAVSDVIEEEPQEQELEQEDQYGLKKLRYKQPLLGRPGNPIGVGDLLARLKALLDELRTINQEEAHRESLMPIAQDLAHQSLLQHKDHGVRAWAVCCVVDMLKLFAPDAPYPASKLKEIFQVIIFKMLPLLSDPSHPYNSQHLYILRSLAEWKSILLINEIPASDQLTSALFTTCFDVLSGPSKSDNGEELSKNVEHNMTEVLSTVIDEAPVVTHEVVDLIVAQFLWADPITLCSSGKVKKGVQADAKQSTLLRKVAPLSYNMAKNICNAFPEKMARLIGNYFSSVIVDFTSLGGSYKHDSTDNNALKGPSDDDLEEANKAHRLLRELWKCCPGVLQEIIPHLQDELATETVQLRQLATETFGDMISGIGAAGPPPLPNLDPVLYPSQSLSPPETFLSFDSLTTPASINSFPTQYPAAYHAFLQRKNDKSAIIRASWVTAIGRILMTSAGGIGLAPEEEQKLLKSFAECLIDSDDKVRLAAVKAIENFSFNDIVRKLGGNGSMSEAGSILSNLADRVKDKKSVIHSETLKLLGKVWGVAVGAIAQGDDTIRNLLGLIPSRILEACYVNDADINMQVDLALFDSLLPLGYPPMKARAATSGNSQVVKDSQSSGEHGYSEAELDRIRVERQLVLVSCLEEKGKKVFFAKQSNQVRAAEFMEYFLKSCEDYNGGVSVNAEKHVKVKLEGLISYYAKTLPDPSRARDDLWKFAKFHDRRAYALIRFCKDPASDYRKVFRSIKELRKRIEDGPGAFLLDTLNPLLYRASLLCYNKSHVPAVIEFTRSDDKELGTTAHELLKEISTHHPKVFSTHVKDLCRTLESEAPTEKIPNPPGAVDDLKACAAFAKKFPTDIPMNARDGRRLVQSFLKFALYGTPPEAAKHAITIIMNSDEKKEFHAKELVVRSIKSFRYNGDHWLTKLAALSQLVSLAQAECEDNMDTIVEIAIQKVLRSPHVFTSEANLDWMDEPDQDIQGRTWAIKVLVNRLRSSPAHSNFLEATNATYALLNRFVKNNGEGSDDGSTPAGHKSRQRLLAAISLLKLSCDKRLDSFLTPLDFIQLALVTHDPCAQVRKGFSDKLMKYLGQGRLPQRFYSILFFCAYEPEKAIKNSTMTWIRSRRAAFANRNETVLEVNFARLISLIAHHPDFEKEDESLKLMSEYILYYLKCVATEDNISLIFHVAQRVKGVADGIVPSKNADERLYILSDLAQALIRSWEEQNGWTIQSWPGKMKLPSGIFRPLESHEKAQTIAKKVWVGDDLIDELNLLVRKAIRNNKRKVADSVEKPRKKPRGEKAIKENRNKSDKLAKVSKNRHGHKQDDESVLIGATAPSSILRRKSDRRSNAHKSYAEISSEEESAEEGAEEGASEEEDKQEGETIGASAQHTSLPKQDVNTEDPGTRAASNLSDAQQSSEHELPKKVTRGHVITMNEGKSSPIAEKRKTTVLEKSIRPVKTAKGKVKVASDPTTISSPVLNGTGPVRRSGRTRS